MSKQPKNDNLAYDRRGWLVSATRWAAFGSLGILAVGLVARDHECCSHGHAADCCDCSALPKCRRPQALETKKQTRKKQDDVGT